MELPYVREACVVAVPMSEGKQLCGATIRPQGGASAESITLARIRSDLHGRLDAQDLPVLLRLLDDKEQLPRTATGKPVKRQVLEDFFHEGDCGEDWFILENKPSIVESLEGLAIM